MTKLNIKYLSTGLGVIVIIIALLGIVDNGGGLSTMSLQDELARCEHTETDALRASCKSFVTNYCAALKDNYWSIEKSEIRDMDVGNRFPVLEPENDPFYPVDCFRQWWLSGASIVRHQVTPKAFSHYAGFTEGSRDYFAYKDENGQLQFPEKYMIEQNYSEHDQKLLRRSLQAAYRYADINVAVEDGYKSGKVFDDGMGIHFTKLSLLDNEIDIDQPEFLTYIKSTSNNAYVLLQIGYIKSMDKNYARSTYQLFESEHAHGHNHFLGCIVADTHGRLTGNMVNYEPSEEEIARFYTPEGRIVSDWSIPEGIEVDQTEQTESHCFDSVWMLHVAVNLYNENGLFADRFSLINSMVSGRELYSFFGRKYSPDDFTEMNPLRKLFNKIALLDK